MDAPTRYDRERGRRYKKWWSQHRGPPEGDVIKVPLEVWTGGADRESVRKRRRDESA